jgi:hypothetical protein
MDAPRIHHHLPKTFRAGETVKFRRSFNDFQSVDGWSFTIYFNGAANVFKKQADAEPDGFLVTLTPDLLNVAPGIYRYLERVERVQNSTKEVHNVGQGVVEIEIDLATAPAGATTSFAERMLAAIEAEIAVRMGADVEEYHSAVAGSSWSVKKVPMEQLQKMRGNYASMVWRQKNPGKIGAPVYIDFVDETNDANFPSTWVDVTGLPGAGQ